MQDFRQLIVWQKSMDLAAACYETTRTLPASERFGLKTQLRRSAISIASNIAEGAGRDSDREFSRFLRIAYGSACEHETQLRIAARVGVLPENSLADAIRQTEDVRRMIAGLLSRTAER